MAILKIEIKLLRLKFIPKSTGILMQGLGISNIFKDRKRLSNGQTDRMGKIFDFINMYFCFTWFEAARLLYTLNPCLNKLAKICLQATKLFTKESFCQQRNKDGWIFRIVIYRIVKALRGY